MTRKILERRRLLHFFMLGAMAVPAVVLAGCAQNAGATKRPPRRTFGGGSNAGEKSGSGGGTAGGRR